MVGSFGATVGALWAGGAWWWCVCVGLVLVGLPASGWGWFGCRLAGWVLASGWGERVFGDYLWYSP